MSFVIGAVGFLFGAFMAWTIGKSQSASAHARVDELRRQLEENIEGFKGLRHKLEMAEEARVTAETRAVEIEKKVTEQQALLDGATTALSDTFSALAAQALKANNTGFLILAEEKFKSLKESADTSLASREEAIGALVKPLEKALSDYQTEAREIEKNRQKELGSVGEQLSSVAAGQSRLQEETARLVGALSSAQVRGRWGEIALRRCAELAGMSGYCDFTEQAGVLTDDGRVRPDMVVHMPAGREVIVDSKVPFSGYDDWCQATATDSEKAAAIERHAACISQHVQSLSAKEYWAAFPAAEFVVMFIPNDSFLAAAVQKDGGLVDEALQRRVVFATPATLYALLRVIERGWQQQKLADNAHTISKLGQELCDRVANFTKNLEAIGKGLANAMKSYGDAAGSFNRLLLPKAKQFKQLGAGGTKEIKELPVLDALTEPSVSEQTVDSSEPVVPSEETRLTHD
ncbi:MAG: DNA recombination protein RmuC [Candidatus Omnitrophica bacterium]|nr:DNA recombination protein RmuC [Candidatus Omnitrophota bacterium]